ncbi:MAG: dUTP diphosphatase [Chloroflexi bacterium]|nr:dUTP diphosphatase [Chloroflexota bacterium]
MKVKRLRPQGRLPRRATPGSTGLDLYACLEAGPCKVGPDPVKVPTGIALEVPIGYDLQVRPRSGLAAQGVAVVLGTIDSDYRGELMVTMYTFGTRPPYAVRDGDRIAQLIVSRAVDLPVVEVEELPSTERGEGGHGSTGA